MRILYASDIHANPDHLQNLAGEALIHAVDTLIIGGDVVPHDLPQASDMGIIDAQANYLEAHLIPVLSRLKNQREIQIFLDLGNDDFAVNRHILEGRSNDLLHLLHMQKHALTDQIDIVGYMMVPPTPFARKDWEKPDCKGHPFSPGNNVRLDGYTTRGGRIQEIRLDTDSNDTIDADLARVSSSIQRPFIFVAHCPPYDTPLDPLFNGMHVGSLSIRQFIERWSAEGKLICSLHGHIHEAPLVSGTCRTRINKTLCINPGQGNDLRFVVLELDETGKGVQIEVVPV